jgi:peptidoglycan/LPS O-acetylase OafA/YrhL
MVFFDSLGPGSVNLFFMTTGFVFYPRILGGLGGANWRAIYISRVFRIMPLLIVSVLAVSAIILRRMNFQPTQNLETTLVNLFRWIVCWDEPSLFGYRDSARVNAGVLWSLGFEWQFYLFVLPICTAAMSLRGRAPTWCIPVTLIMVSLALRPLHFLALITYLPLFGVGMIAFEIKERERIAAFLSTRAASTVGLALFIAGSVLFSGMMRLICHTIFFTCVACGASIWGLLRTSAARALGELSYGVYLLHGLALNILFVDLSGMIDGAPTEKIVALMPLAAVGTMLLSASTFLLVERPFIDIGKLVARKRRSPLT